MYGSRPNGSSAVHRLKRGNAIKIYDRISFKLYTILMHVCISFTVVSLMLMRTAMCAVFAYFGHYLYTKVSNFYTILLWNSFGSLGNKLGRDIGYNTRRDTSTRSKNILSVSTLSCLYSWVVYIPPSIVLPIQQVGFKDNFPPWGLQGKFWLIIPLHVFLVYSLLHCQTIVQILHHFTVTVNNIEVAVKHLHTYRCVYNNHEQQRTNQVGYLILIA